MQRDSRLDVARGTAIISIVLVHVVRGLLSAGMVDESLKEGVDRAVGLWCLAVFAFVGGTLVPRSVLKVGQSAYLRDRTVRFVVVYLIWSVLQGMLHLMAGGEANHQRSVGEIFRFWIPDGQLWYLPFLVIASLVFVPMKPWLSNRAVPVCALAAAISLGFWGYDGGYIGTQGLGLVVFFVAGMAIGSAKVQAALDRFSILQAAVISLVVLIGSGALCIWTTAIPPSFYWFQATPTRIAIGVVLSLVSSAALLLFGHAAQSVSFLSLCGRRSLEIYLAHVILVAGTRIVLVKFGVLNIWVLIVTCLVTAVLGSLALSVVLRRIGLGWVFDGPAWLVKLTSR